MLVGLAARPPLALLAADASSGAPEVRQAALHRFETLVAEVRTTLAATDEPEHLERAATALVIGALALAQAQPDTEARERLLEACRRGVDALTTPRRDVDIAYFWAAPAEPGSPFRHTALHD